MPKITDHSGMKYGRLTFVRKTELRNKSGDIKWELLCDCGKLTYCTANNVVKGRTKSCGCLDYDNKHTDGRVSRQYEPRISSARAAWSTNYKDGDIDFDTFFELSQQNCYYCNRAPHNTYNVGSHRPSSEWQKRDGDFIYNGLDRIDNTRGHMKDNVVTCCKVCNLMRLATPQKEFLENIKMIYNHLFI